MLYIDDHESSLAGWCLYLQNAGYTVETARTPQEGLELFAIHQIDLVVLDYSMPELNGDEVAATMKQIKPNVRIVMFSGASMPKGAESHVDAFVAKGQHPVVLAQKIEELLREQAA